MHPDLPDRFAKVIVPHCRFIASADQLAADGPLSTLGIDSLEIVELIIDLEDAFSVQIPQEMLTPETFATPATIWQAVVSLVNGSDVEHEERLGAAE